MQSPRVVNRVAQVTVVAGPGQIGTRSESEVLGPARAQRVSYMSHSRIG
jgi:hypothetical protein